MAHVAYRGWTRVALVLLATTGILACESSDKGAAAALPQDGAVCVDRDGDGFGEGCSKGRDCDDAKAEITNECRSCLEPDLGCACETGVEPVACFLDASDLPDGRLMCHEGTRFCRDGAWGACESIHSYVMERPAATHLVPDAGHPNCTPCDVLCYRIDDNLDPVDGGLTDANSSGVSWIPGGGLSNTSFLIDAGSGPMFDAAVDTDAAVPPCQLGVPPDTDCDGLDDDVDPYPGTPPFATTYDTIYHELAAGQTGTSALDLRFNVNNADIYFLIDQSGSMDGERDRLITDLRTGTFLDPSVDCVDTDDPDSLPNNELKAGGIIGSIRCLIRDAWFGAGYFVEYALAPNGEAYVDGRTDDDTVFRNVQTMTQSITDVNNALGTMFTNGNVDTPESDIPALWSMATGQGMYLGHNRQGVPPQTQCPPDTFGYPCFRNTAIPIVILITDASFHNGPAPTPNAYQASYNISGGTSSTITPVPNGNEDFLSAFDIGDITNRLVTFGGDTKNAVGNVPGNLMGCGASSATRDVVFKFDVTAPRVVTIKTDGTVQDTLISLFRALPETAPSSSTPVSGESYAVGDVYDRWIELTGSTSGLAANYQGGVLGCNAGAAGRDMLFSFTPSQNMSLTAVSGMSDRVGWWRMGDGDVYPNIADVTGEHEGSMKSMTAASFVADAPSGGTFSNTISTTFNGTNQRVEVANDFELDITDALTASVWVKGAIQDNTILSKFETTGNRRSWRIATTATGKARINVSATGGPYDSSNVKEYNSALTVLDGTWHHIAFTYMAGSPDGTLKVYIDGVEDTNVTKSYDPLVPSLFSTSAPVTIGGYYSNSDLFVGEIDEVAIWHAALSAAELRVIYNHGQAQDLARIGGTTVALYSAPPPSNPATTAIANNNDSASSAYNVSNDLTGVYQAFSGNTSAVGVTPSMTAATVGCGTADDSNDVSYRFRLASNRRVRIDTEGSSFDTVLSLHSSTPAGLTPRTSSNANDNAGSVEAIGDISNVGYAYSGNSSALRPDFDGSSVGCSAANGANDAVYSFTLPSMKHVHIDTRETTAFDSVVSLHSALPSPVTTVSDNSNETLGTEGTLGTINGARKQLTGNTSAMTADYSAAIVGCGATGGARDAVAKFTLTSPATVEIDSQGSSFNTVLGLFNERYPTSDLVSWWRLGDGDTYPSVTGVINGFTGTMNNMAANDFEYVTPLQDYPNTLSTNFDGSNDQITIPDNNTLDFTSAMTASVWVRGAGQDRSIFTKYTTTSNQRSWRIYGTAAGGFAVMVSRDGTSSASAAKTYVTTGVTALDATAWHHVAFTFAAGTLTLYVDGVEAAVTKTNDPAMTTIFSGTSPVSIGSHFDATATSFFNGNIDEPTLWSAALTSTQIASLYNAGKPTDPRTLDRFPTVRPDPVDVASVSTSLDFDGSNDTLLTTDTALNINNNLSVSLWANVATSGARTLASRYRTSPTNLRAWRMVSDAGRFRVYLSPNGSLTSPNYKDYSTVATVFGSGWTHVAFTFASGTLKLYVNGVEVTGAALTKTVDGAVATLYAPVSPAATRVGGYENNATGGVTEIPSGRIDEFSIWSTTALSDAEITALYNSGVPTNLKGATNLALWWRMGELDSYSTISDRAAVPHAGTMTNMASNDFVAGVPGATFYENETKATAYDVGTINGRWRTFRGNTSTMIADTGGFGCGSGAGEKDAFFKFTLSSATSLDIDTIGSGFDTALGVFPASATAFNAGELLGCDNDSGGSTTSSLNTGTLAAGTYYVVIKGSGGGSGAYQLSIKDTAGQALANNILGTRIACDANDGTETTSRITQTLAAGTYHVVVKSTGGSGAYNLRISEQGAVTNQLACARPTSAGSATPPDAGCTFQLYGGHGYWFCNGSRSWAASRTLCQAIGYDLISIDDAAEQAFAQLHRSGETHIGMNDIAVEGVYGWINGSTATYTAWGSGQPNNNGGSQDCSEIYNPDGTWNDNDCAETQHFICESGTLSPQVIDQTLAAGTYYVIVKGTSATAEGAYQMTIRDVDASTPPLYCNDDGSVDGSSAIEADLLANTDYYVTVKGKSAAAKGAYRVAFRDATGVPSNLMACGNQDLTTTMLTAGQTYYAAVKGDALVGDGPFSLIFQDSNNTGDQLIACDDNFGPGLQSRIDQMLDPGTYYLAMKKANHSRGQGNYQISFGGGASAASTYSPPTWAQTIAALNARRIRVMTVYSTGNDTLATIQQHAEALANATNAVGSGGTPLVSSIAPDGTGLSSALVDQVQELAQYISMNMRLRVSYNPDTPPAPGFLFHFVAVDESPGNGCTGVVGFEHQQCLPGSTPRFQVNITNPLGSPVPPNPSDPLGGYSFRIQLIANNQYVMEEVPVYILPLQTTYVPPNTRYAPVGVYTQDVDGRSCMGNQRPSWRDLLFNTTVPDGGSVAFDACTGETPAELATCSFSSVATVTGSGTCMTTADCDTGETCAANGVCLAITAGACVSNVQCASTATCVNNVCMYSGSPVSVLQGIGASNDYRHWMRLRVTMRTNPAATEAPRLDQWQMRYECDDIQ